MTFTQLLCLIKMKRKLIAILLITSIIGLMVIWLIPNVIKMYGCAEGGGQWSWRNLECTPYQDLVEFKTIDTEARKSTEVTFGCDLYNFESNNERADSLTSFLKKAVQSDIETREKWEQKFFCAFPNSFEGMQAIFGYDSEEGAAPLYSTENPSHNYMNKRIFSDVIGFFSDLQSIPDSVFYTKYVKINIDGHWEADNISEAFGFHYRLINNTKAASKILENFTDEEIRSVFRFIFDGPHPKNEHNEEIFQTLKPIIEEQNERLGNLLFEAYATMMADDDGHGH